LFGIGCGSSSREPAVTVSGNAKPLSPTALASRENDNAYRLIYEGKLDAAEAALRRALDLDDRFGPAHNNLGLVYAHTDRPYDAAVEYETAARLMPRAAEPHNNLGLVLEEAGKLSDAIEAYEYARARDEDNPQYLANLARAKVRRGDRGEDVIGLLETLRVRTNDPRWRDWARTQLIRLNASPTPNPVPAPAGSTRPSPLQ
jgi:Flp pilus assembly protein TadD